MNVFFIKIKVDYIEVRIRVDICKINLYKLYYVDCEREYVNVIIKKQIGIGFQKKR